MTPSLRLVLATGAALAVAPRPTVAQSTNALAARGPAAIAAPAAKHILYRVQGPNGATVYLLGSVHLLSANAATLPAEVDTAFAHARTLTLEASLDSAVAAAPRLMALGRFADGQTLRSTLSPAAAARVDSVLHLYGLSLDQLNGFKPWFVGMLMAQLAMQKMSLQAQYGVDVQLNARAKQAAKPVLGLEGIDVQVGMLDRLSPADQERMLVDSDGPEIAAKQMAAIQDAWTHGDAAGLDSLVNARLGEAPSIFDAIIGSRNRAWVPKIEAMITGHDDALIVVGAGHLVGKDGVVAMLRAKGYAIDQM
jgi:uncharacterized protein